MLSHVKKERKAQIEKTTREVFLSLKPYRFRLGKAYFFAKIFVPYLTTTYGQPEKSLISCGFARLDLFTSTCFCLSWCVMASVFSGVNGFWLRSILNPPQRKLIEQKTKIRRYEDKPASLETATDSSDWPLGDAAQGVPETTKTSLLSEPAAEWKTGRCFGRRGRADSRTI